MHVNILYAQQPIARSTIANAKRRMGILYGRPHRMPNWASICPPPSVSSRPRSTAKQPSPSHHTSCLRPSQPVSAACAKTDPPPRIWLKTQTSSLTDIRPSSPPATGPARDASARPPTAFRECLGRPTAFPSLVVKAAQKVSHHPPKVGKQSSPALPPK